MINDPIVDSVRATRDELARAFHYDVHAIFADLRKRESCHSDRVIDQTKVLRTNDPIHQSDSLDGASVGQR